MDLGLSGKVAIVTGGGSGLGAAISRGLAAEGAHVVVNYIVKPDENRLFAEELSREYHVDCIALEADITNSEQIDQMLAEVWKHYGRCDILVNNAGVWPTAYVKDMEDSEWEKTIAINLTGPFKVSKRMVQRWIGEHVHGKIVNIVSQAAFHGSTTGHAHYAAAKGGMVTFTVSLAREVAQYGINVTAVAPGMMRTPMNAEQLSDPEKEKTYLSRIPLGRISEPEEVANAVLFLASNKADYITGATIDVTGGMLMR